MEVGQALRGRHLRALLVHPQGDPVHRRRGRRLGIGDRRLPLRHRNRSQPGAARIRHPGDQITIGLFPAIMAIVAMLVFWKYPLTDKLFRQIRDENEARKLELAAKGQQLY